MIPKLILTSRTTEVDAVSIRLIGAYSNTNLNTDVHLEAIFTTLETKSIALTSAIRRMKVASILEEKDEVRDQRIRSLFHLVQSYLHFPNSIIQAEAVKVEKVLDNYGLSVTGESYATESSLVNSMLADLAAADLQPSIAAISGCADFIAALQTAQHDFEDTRIAYEEEKAGEATLANATALKKEVVGVVNDQLVVYLRAMNLVDVETYGTFAGTVAEIIADNNEVVKRRRKKPEPAE